MPSDWLQLSVLAAGFAAGAGALADEDRAVEDARGAAGAGAAGAAAAGAAFGLAGAFADWLAFGLADAGARERPAVRAARILVDAVESTPTPPCVVPLRPAGRAASAESCAPCECPPLDSRP
jgi:hypothetical protein